VLEVLTTPLPGCPDVDGHRVAGRSAVSDSCEVHAQVSGEWLNVPAG
jgi:hypothetical protein